MLLDHDKPKTGNGGRMGGSRDNRSGGYSGGGYRKPYDRGGDRRGNTRYSRTSGNDGGGPHFPTSRLLEQVKGKYDR